MVIFVNELVECKLKIITLIDGMKSVELIKGRGYCKKEDSFLVVYFTSDNIKYKYEYDGEKLIVFCNANGTNTKNIDVTLIQRAN